MNGKGLITLHKTDVVKCKLKRNGNGNGNSYCSLSIAGMLAINS